MIQTDVSKSGWEAFATVCQPREMVRDGREFEHNILDLIATKCSFLTFTKGPSNIAINLKKDSKTSLSYHLKMEGTHNKELLYISKTI